MLEFARLTLLALVLSQAEGMERYQNLGAVAVLRGPGWDDPDFVQFDAVHPRPDVAATYEASPCPLAVLPI